MRHRFYLVRHGEAERGTGASDAERRLTANGRAAFEALARALAPSVRLARIVTSPYRRARETAAILGAATGAPVEVEQALAAGRCTGPELLALARAAGGGVALVGHNPEVAEAVIMAAGRDERVPAGTVAALEAGAGTPRLAWIRTT
ncbi:MAG TPA: histidine phosphatase family protein [Anaeromyxobacteraceae bacterium]|nr:histidine phosphatase family protein [Anaeromyxobacteraceae bacterium]